MRNRSLIMISTCTIVAVVACSSDETEKVGSLGDVDASTADASSRTDGASDSDGSVISDAASDTAAPSDAGTDVSTDAAHDVSTDAGPDADSDAEADAAPTDAGQDASTDAGQDASTDAGQDASTDAGAPQACGSDFQVGEYGTYLGKVNVHRSPGSAWAVDNDCSSGANNNTVAYCQKFWPNATSQASVPVTGNKPYTAGGGTAPTCGGVYNEPGQAQYACCAPNPCGAGLVPVGTYVTWSGKVNVHRAIGASWSVDSDCSSGANENTVTYCKKFWPNATTQVEVGVEATTKPFTAGGGSAPGCGGVYPGPGHNQYLCCAPNN